MSVIVEDRLSASSGIATRASASHPDSFYIGDAWLEVPASIRRPWQVFVDDFEEMEVMSEARMCVLRWIRKKGGGHVFASLLAHSQTDYIVVSLMELSAYACFRAFVPAPAEDPTTL